MVTEQKPLLLGLGPKTTAEEAFVGRGDRPIQRVNGPGDRP